MRRAMWELLKDLPPNLRQKPHFEVLTEEAHEKVYNIIELIYHARHYEGSSKDYEFSRRTMEEHWMAGYHDPVRTLRHPEVLQRPTSSDGIRTFDITHDARL